MTLLDDIVFGLVEAFQNEMFVSLQAALFHLWHEQALTSKIVTAYHFTTTIDIYL